MLITPAVMLVSVVLATCAHLRGDLFLTRILKDERDLNTRPFFEGVVQAHEHEVIALRIAWRQ